jgi:hypothetical protein
MAVKATTYQAGIHVPEHELLPPQSCCPLCFAEGPRQPALLVQSNPDVLLLHCKRCRAYSASRMPAEETLRRYYAHYYDGCSGSMRSPASFARHFMNHAGSLLRPESPAILDFGGGAGDLSRAIAVRLLRHAFISTWWTTAAVSAETMSPRSPFNRTLRSKRWREPISTLSWPARFWSTSLRHGQFSRASLQRSGAVVSCMPELLR